MMPTVERLRWSAQSFLLLRREHRMPWKSPAFLLEKQREALGRLVRHAFDRVPFYRDAMLERRLRPEDIRSVEDLRYLPVVDGDMLRDMPDAFRPRPSSRGSQLSLVSSGTSGRRKVTVYDTRALIWSLVHGQRQRQVIARAIGRTHGYRELSVLKRGGAFEQVRGFYDRHVWVPEHLRVVRRSFEPGSLAIDDEVAFINEFAPDVVVGYGSYLGPRFRAMAARGGLTRWPRVLVYGSDAMLAGDRAFIETELKIPVFSVYQATESLRIGFQCEERRWMHVSVDACAVRILDAHGNDAAPGAPGEVALSNLLNYETVLLNYRLGDLAVMHEAPCPCGRGLPLLQLLEGRSADVIRGRDGRIIHALPLLERLREATGIERLQIVQHDWDAFTVRVVPDAMVDRAECDERVAQVLSYLLGERCDVRLEWPEALKREAGGKVRLVTSRLPHGESPENVARS